MGIEATSYPLHWPQGWTRTKAAQRSTARFRASGASVTLLGAVQRLTLELRRLGVRDEDVIISTNVRPTLSGVPNARSASPMDPGAAVYFRLRGKDRALACDKWSTLGDNIVAIAWHIRAIRSIDRYGVGTMDQAFAGYAALPPRGGTWRSTLGFGVDDVVTPAMIRDAYLERAKSAHPDQGGSHEAMSALNAAREAGMAEV